MIADQGVDGSRIALATLSGEITTLTTLFQLPWQVNPLQNGTGQEQFAPIMTQAGTGPLHLLVYFGDSTTSTLYSVETTAPTVFTPILQLEQNLPAGQHITTVGNHIVYDGNTKTILLTDGSTNSVIEVDPSTSPATTKALFSDLAETPTSIALKFNHVFIQIGNSIYVGNRTGGSLSLVASGFSQLTNLAVGTAPSGNGLSLYAVDQEYEYGI
jgi:hypothetical protein